MTNNEREAGRWRVQTNGLKSRVFVTSEDVELEVHSPKLTYGERLEIANHLVNGLNKVADLKSRLAGAEAKCACLPDDELGPAEVTEFCPIHGDPRKSYLKQRAEIYSLRHDLAEAEARASRADPDLHHTDDDYHAMAARAADLQSRLTIAEGLLREVEKERTFRSDGLTFAIARFLATSDSPLAPEGK